MEPRKKGRPYIGDGERNVIIKVRMEPKEVDELDSLAENMHTTRSGVIRKGIQLVKDEIGKEK